jgi:hypothetical protein
MMIHRLSHHTATAPLTMTISARWRDQRTATSFESRDAETIADSIGVTAQHFG